MRPVVRPLGGDERLAEILQGGFAGVADVRFGQDDPYSLSETASRSGLGLQTLAG